MEPEAEATKRQRAPRRWWRVAYWVLFIVWTGCALLGMNRIRAGFLTSYGADLTQPAWLYIVVRGLHGAGQNTWLVRLLGATPTRAALSIFAAGVLTETSQLYWPRGVFSGRFDPLDIVAFAVGIGVCYMLDSRSDTRPVDEGRAR